MQPGGHRLGLSRDPARQHERLLGRVKHETRVASHPVGEDVCPHPTGQDRRPDAALHRGRQPSFSMSQGNKDLSVRPLLLAHLPCGIQHVVP